MVIEEKIIKIMSKYSYGPQTHGEKIIFLKHSNLFGLDFSLEFKRKNIEKEIKTLGKREGIIENLIKFSQYPIITDNFLGLCKDLMEIRADVIQADEEINGNNHTDEIKLLKEAIEIDYEAVYDKIISEINTAKSKKEKMDLICKYAEIDRESFEELKDLESFVSEKHNALISKCKNNLELKDFVREYKDLYYFELAFDDFEDEIAALLKSSWKKYLC